MDELFALLESAAGQLYGGEAVTQLEHALQCAALASAAGADAALVSAALFHDVGHLLDEEFAGSGYWRRDLGHEHAGARYLSRWLGEAVTRPVLLHVEAKRYLCTVEAGYWDALSAASRHSLELQGGPLSPQQARRFARQPDAGAAIALRRWDDQAKAVNAPTPALETFRPVVASVVRSRQ